MNAIARILFLNVFMVITMTNSAQYYNVLCEDTCAHIHGIDISHYQGRINWEKLRNASIGDAPVSFVFIKATEG